MKNQPQSSVLAIAVANTLKGVQFSSDRVIELLKYAGKSSMEDMLRCLYYLTGQLQMPDPASIVEDNKGRILAFISYNIFEDVLKYEYDAVDHRCFRTQDEADSYSVTGNYDYKVSLCSDKPTGDYPFLGTYRYTGKGNCCLDTWESYSPVEK